MVLIGLINGLFWGFGQKKHRLIGIGILQRNLIHCRRLLGVQLFDKALILLLFRDRIRVRIRIHTNRGRVHLLRDHLNLLPVVSLEGEILVEIVLVGEGSLILQRGLVLVFLNLVQLVADRVVVRVLHVVVDISLSVLRLLDDV